MGSEFRSMNVRSDEGRHARTRMAERLAPPRDSVPFELSAVRRRRRPPPAGGRGTRLRRGAASRVRPSTRSRGLALSFRQILDGSRALAAFTHILRGMAWHTPPLASLPLVPLRPARDAGQVPRVRMRLP